MYRAMRREANHEHVGKDVVRGDHRSKFAWRDWERDNHHLLW